MDWEEKTTYLLLYSDTQEDEEGVQVVAVAVYKDVKIEFPKDYTGFRGDWAAYISGAPSSYPTDLAIAKAVRKGSKLTKAMARAIFPGVAAQMDKKKQPYRP